MSNSKYSALQFAYDNALPDEWDDDFEEVAEQNVDCGYNRSYWGREPEREIEYDEYGHKYYA